MGAQGRPSWEATTEQRLGYVVRCGRGRSRCKGPETRAWPSEYNNEPVWPEQRCGVRGLAVRPTVGALGIGAQ